MKRFKLIILVCVSLMWLPNYMVQIHSQTIYSLNDCIQLSLKNNLQTKNGELDQQSVQSRINEAKSGFLPSVDLNGQYQYYITMPKMLVPADFFPGNPPGSYMEFTLGSPQTTVGAVQVSQLLFNQKVFIGLRAAKTAKNLTDLQLSKTKEDLVYNVSAVYYNLQMLQQNLNMIDSNLVILDKILSTSKVLQANEIISKTNLKRLQINYDNLRNERNNLELTNNKAYNLLKFLMRVPLSEALQIAAFQPTLDISSHQKGNIENRIDVRLGKEQIGLAELDKKASIADYYPSLSGVFNYSVTGYYDKVSPFKSINDRWMQGSYVALQLKIPVFSGLSRYYQVKQKDLALQKARNNYELMKSAAEKDMADAENNYMSTNNSFENAKRSMELAQDVFSSSETEYRNGLLSLSDLLQVQNELTTSRNNYSTALINMRQAEIELKKANGELITK